MTIKIIHHTNTSLQTKRNKTNSATRQVPNDPSSATRPAGRHDCNSDAMAGFAAARVCVKSSS